MPQAQVHNTIGEGSEWKHGGIRLLLEADYRGALLQELLAARRRVWIMAYFWGWSQDAPASELGRIQTRVCQLAALGGDVRIILDKPSQALKLRGSGIKARVLPGARIMHSKVFLIDDDVLFVGSHNLSTNGVAHNFEATVQVRDPDTAAFFATYFERLWNNLAER